MPRTVDAVAHAQRRNGFLDAAQRLIETKGYARMTIQDVLDHLGTSKGALYHYFDSKEALLEGIVERFTDAAEAHLARSAADDGLPALERLRQFFATVGQWKTEQRHLLLAALTVWESADNALVRERMRTRVVERIAPPLASLIARAVDEGALTTRYPDLAARMILGLGHDLNELLIPRLCSPPADDTDEDVGIVMRVLDAHADAIERVLGAPPGALVTVDAARLRLWFDAARAQRPGRARDAKGDPDDHVH